jgi:hypothetical protein
MSLHPEDRFWRYVDKRGPDECWPWKSTKLPGKWPYGIWSVGGKRVSAHRIAYALQDGWEAGLREIPEDMLVCHHCDNPSCCNPKHLFLGTPKDNTADMDRKGRRGYVKGEDNGNSKLTLMQAQEIKRSGETYRELAERYGVSIPAIQSIKNGRTWKNA